MSQQGPILVVSDSHRPAFAAELDKAEIFPVVDTTSSDASRAIDEIQPAAVLADPSAAASSGFERLANQIAARPLYLPMIAIDAPMALPANVIPFSQTGGHFDRLIARLRACLRVRTLHATVMRRLDEASAKPAQAETDSAHDATVLLIGRGAAYPSLSVSLGHRMGVVGALSIEAAAKHLNIRDIDGIVLGEGFSPRVVDAFLTVLAEDARFRNLPVVVTTENLVPDYDLPNLEIIAADSERIAAHALPMIRQHALETHLSRTLRSIDAGGLLDSRTGLLTLSAFERDFATAVYQTLSRGGGLSVARFVFDSSHERARIDGARILSRLMRQMDFGAVQDDGSAIVVFAETDLRTAHMIAKRLSSVMRHTTHGKREARTEPSVTLATLLPNDSAKSVLSRLYQDSRRAAS